MHNPLIFCFITMLGKERNRRGPRWARTVRSFEAWSNPFQEQVTTEAARKMNYSGIEFAFEARCLDYSSWKTKTNVGIEAVIHLASYCAGFAACSTWSTTGPWLNAHHNLWKMPTRYADFAFGRPWMHAIQFHDANTLTNTQAQMCWKHSNPSFFQWQYMPITLSIFQKHIDFSTCSGWLSWSS